MRRGTQFTLTVLLGAGALMVLAPMASATTFTVDSTLDVDDGGAPNNGCEAAGGDECTLREAINATNVAAGLDTIQFSIGTGLQTIQPTSGLPALSDDNTIVNGDSQPGDGSAPRIELDGELVASDGLTITGSDVAVFGLTINQFGGALAAGILVDGGDDAVIQGNYIGTDVDGEAGFTGGNTQGVVITNGATGAQIGGQPSSEGNVISNNADAGIAISDGSPTQAVVQGNKIGTDPTGTLAVANGNVGIEITATSNIIGDLDNASPDLSNVIAFNGSGGGIALIATSPLHDDNVIARNSIFYNAGIGIDLHFPDIGADGVTANDTAPDPFPDSDSGPNGLQNYPLIDTVTVDDTAVDSITGTLQTQPGSYDALFYASETCDIDGFGEGQRYIGSETIVTDAGGQANFQLVPQIISGGQVAPDEQITVTVEGGEGTSEFSNCVPAVGTPDADDGTVVAGPVSGTIFVKFPGSDVFEALEGPSQIPERSIVDATDGEVRIVSDAPDEPGGIREAIFSRGRFKIIQDDPPRATLEGRLTGGVACGAGKHRRALKKRELEILTKGGRHRSRGRHGSGTVRGTNWLTRDQCNGTLFRVFEGSVRVKDFVKNKNVKVDAGETYLAKEKKG